MHLIIQFSCNEAEANNNPLNSDNPNNPDNPYDSSTIHDNTTLPIPSSLASQASNNRDGPDNSDYHSLDNNPNDPNHSPESGLEEHEETDDHPNNPDNPDHVDNPELSFEVCEPNNYHFREKHPYHVCPWLARATIWVGQSATFRSLIESYYQIYIVSQQNEYSWKNDTCPVFFYRFKLTQFNKDLSKLHDYVRNMKNEGSENMDLKKEEKLLLNIWYGDLLNIYKTDSEILKLPKIFPLLITKYQDGDLLISPTLTIHAVHGN